jgi:hypothetical protein
MEHWLDKVFGSVAKLSEEHFYLNLEEPVLTIS